MRQRWVRVEPDAAVSLRAALTAGALAVGVGTATFWIVRLFLSREPIGGGREPDRQGSSPGSGEDA